MIDDICIATNKHPAEDESKRLYYLPGQKIPGYSGDLCARLKAGFLKLDIDDFDHKTGEIDDPIQGKPRSEAVKAWLDSKGIRYNLMITEHGKHFYFRVPPDYPHDANKVNWYTALGIKVEPPPPGCSGCHSPESPWGSSAPHRSPSPFCTAV